MKIKKALLVLKSLHTQLEQREDKLYANALETLIDEYESPSKTQSTIKSQDEEVDRRYSVDSMN